MSLAQHALQNVIPLAQECYGFLYIFCTTSKNMRLLFKCAACQCMENVPPPTRYVEEIQIDCYKHLLQVVSIVDDKDLQHTLPTLFKPTVFTPHALPSMPLSLFIGLQPHASFPATLSAIELQSSTTLTTLCKGHRVIYHDLMITALELLRVLSMLRRL